VLPASEAGQLYAHDVSAWAAAVIGVVGTLVGTALGGLIAGLNEKSRWKREQAARWSDERRILYSQVIAACEDVVEVTWTLEKPTYRDVHNALKDPTERLRGHVAELELVGTENDATAARELLATARSVLTAAVRDPEAPAQPLIEKWVAAREKFRQQARRGLHLT
jgi:hypothetical protein